MNSGGYDYEFVPELPDEYVCVICQLALRKPKQIIQCGHRYCESCLDDFQSHGNLGTILHCPIDRQSFTMDQVFCDKGFERSILNWKIKCPNHIENGCTWIGEVNSIEDHKKQCIDSSVDEKKMKKLLHEKQELAKKCDVLESVIQKMNKHLSVNDIEVNKLRREKERIEDELNTVTGLNKTLQIANDQLNQELKKSNYENKCLQNMNNAYKEEIQKCQNDLSKLACNKCKKKDGGKQKSFCPKTIGDINKGMNVCISHTNGCVYNGTVKWIGKLPNKHDVSFGIDCEEEVSNCSGRHDGVRYFRCKKNHGIFVNFEDVIMVWR